MIDKIWNLMTQCFPSDERSSYEIQKSLFNNPNYNCIIIEEKDMVVGFVCYWSFENFNYIEHLCVKKENRGQGLGEKLVKKVINKNKKIILEIEDTKVENNYMELKRLNFYKSLGFHLISCEYFQPPLNKNDQPIKMELLTYPILFTDEEIKDTINIIKNSVYKNRF